MLLWGGFTAMIAPVGEIVVDEFGWIVSGFFSDGESSQRFIWLYQVTKNSCNMYLRLPLSVCLCVCVCV